MMEKSLNPAVRRRNRMLLIILLGLALGMAVWSNLFLRHYGFNLKDDKTERYH